MNPSVEGLKRLMHRFWWLRGFVAGVSLTALIPDFTDMSRFEWLRAFHALIAGWQSVASMLGHWVGKFYFLPELNKFQVNAVIIALTMGLPICIDHVYDFIYEIKKFRKIKNIVNFYNLSISILVIIFVIPGTYALYMALSIYILDEKSLNSFQAVFLFLSIFSSLFLLVYAVVKFPSIGRGFVHFFVLMGTLEVLYAIETPFLSDWINALACEVLQDDGPGCVPA